MRIFRNLAEFVAMFVVWGALLLLIHAGWLGNAALAGIVVLVAWCKTAFFGAENLRELWQASQRNIAYHRFMLLMLMNMSQIITSFALDYHCLHWINPASFGSVGEIATEPKLVFEFFYYSVLNFTFFGYGDVTPQTVPAKLLTMTEIILAFVTVIFLLSDFISLKESIRGRPEIPGQGSDTVDSGPRMKHG
jgi:hypothetical protein